MQTDGRVNRVACRDGVNIRRRAAQIDRHQISQALFAWQAVAQQRQRLQHRRGRRHQDAIQYLAVIRKALAADNTLQKNLPDDLLGGRYIKLAKSGHHIGRGIHPVGAV